MFPQGINIPDVMPLRVCDFLNATAKYSREECGEMLAQVNCEYLLLSAMQDIFWWRDAACFARTCVIKKTTVTGSG